MSSNKSRNNQTTSTANYTTDQTLAATDNRVSESGAAVGGNVSLSSGDIMGGVSVSTTDQGAVMAATDIALESIRSVGSLVGAAQSSASDSIGQAYGLANEARQSETSGAINNFLKYGAIVLVVGLIAYSLRKSQ